MKYLSMLNFCYWLGTSHSVTLKSRFSKCEARPTGGEQRRDRWGANGRYEQEIFFFYP